MTKPGIIFSSGQIKNNYSMVVAKPPTSQLEAATVATALTASTKTAVLLRPISANRAFKVLTGTAFDPNKAPLMESLIYDFFEEVACIHQKKIKNLSFDYIDTLLEEVEGKAPQNLHAVLKLALKIGETCGEHDCKLKAHLEKWFKKYEKPAAFTDSKKLGLTEEQQPAAWMKHLLYFGFAAYLLSSMLGATAPLLKPSDPSQTEPDPVPDAPFEPPTPPRSTVHFCKEGLCDQVEVPTSLLDGLAMDQPATEFLKRLERDAHPLLPNPLLERAISGTSISNSSLALSSPYESLPMPELGQEDSTSPFDHQNSYRNQTSDAHPLSANGNSSRVEQAPSTRNEWIVSQEVPIRSDPAPRSPFDPKKIEEIFSRLLPQEAGQLLAAIQELERESYANTFTILKNSETLTRDAETARQRKWRSERRLKEYEDLLKTQTATVESTKGYAKKMADWVQANKGELDRWTTHYSTQEWETFRERNFLAGLSVGIALREFSFFSKTRLEPSLSTAAFLSGLAALYLKTFAIPSQANQYMALASGAFLGLALNRFKLTVPLAKACANTVWIGFKILQIPWKAIRVGREVVRFGLKSTYYYHQSKRKGVPLLTSGTESQTPSRIQFPSFATEALARVNLGDWVNLLKNGWLEFLPNRKTSESLFSKPEIHHPIDDVD